MGRVTTRRPVLRISPDHHIRRPDTLAVEEPLEIRLEGIDLTLTMRTPGHDVDLVHGFLLAEGIIAAREDINRIRYCDGTDDDGTNTYNVLDATLAEHVRPPVLPAPRGFLTTSACGVCGKASLDDVQFKTQHSPRLDLTVVTAAALQSMPRTLREAQRVFEVTGGLHAAGLFTVDGTLLAVREDIGRHNAVDKVIGWALRENRIPLSGTCLIVSGRASFELVQKAVMAGIPLLGAVSAPSSLAVDLASEAGLTLAGFVRGDTMNVYTHERRISL